MYVVNRYYRFIKNDEKMKRSRLLSRDAMRADRRSPCVVLLPQYNNLSALAHSVTAPLNVL